MLKRFSTRVDKLAITFEGCNENCIGEVVAVT